MKELKPFVNDDVIFEVLERPHEDSRRLTVVKRKSYTRTTVKIKTFTYDILRNGLLGTKMNREMTN